jgi:hypothetical protein
MRVMSPKVENLKEISDFILLSLHDFLTLSSSYLALFFQRYASSAQIVVRVQEISSSPSEIHPSIHPIL